MNLEDMGDIMQHRGDQRLGSNWEQICWHPILVGGDFDFQRNFESLLISDGQSKSVNLIWTVQNLIQKAEKMALSNQDWNQVFSLCVQKYLELAANINTDCEIAELRSALCMIKRKHQKQVHIPVFRIKSLYHIILSLNQPHLSEEKIAIRSDHLAISCIQHLFTPSTFIQFQVFVYLKSQELEETGCVVKNRPAGSFNWPQLYIYQKIVRC